MVKCDVRMYMLHVHIVQCVKWNKPEWTRNKLETKTPSTNEEENEEKENR